MDSSMSTMNTTTSTSTLHTTTTTANPSRDAPTAPVASSKSSTSSTSPPTPMSEKYSLPQDLDTLHSGSTTRANTPLADIEKGQDEGTVTPSDLPFRKLLCIVIALMVNQFLATSDATIVSTSLPTIVTDLHGTQNEYAWVPVAYLLTQTACQPLYGKLADIFGRKPVIYASTFIFLIGSALCGAAQNMRWLILARGLAGIGGGGIVNSVWVLTTEIVPPGTQAKWSQALSVTWSASAVSGPILGGLFTGQVSWRWAFYINLPIGSLALGILWYFLRRVHLVRKLADGSEDTRPRNIALRQTLRSIDYIGLLLLMSGTAALVIGFSFAGFDGWTSPRTLGLLISGVVCFISAGIYESYYLRITNRSENALIPAGVFKQWTVINVLIIAILHNFAFTAGTYYIPLLYQALHGTSPLVAGMQVLPFSLGAALATVPTAWFISWKPGHRWVNCALQISIAIGLALSAIGYGLMIMLDEFSGLAVQEIYPLIAGVGIGILFHAPFQVVTNALPKRDLAQATGAFFLVRFMGTTTGLSVAGAVFESNWLARRPLGFEGSSAAGPNGNPLQIDLRSLVHIMPLELRHQVLAAVSASVSTVWVVCTPCLGVAFLLSLLLRVHHHESHPDPTKDLSKDLDLSTTIPPSPATTAADKTVSTVTTPGDVIEKPMLELTIPALPNHAHLPRVSTL